MLSLQHDPNVNIEQYPSVDPLYPFDKGAQLTLGDLHGNALKLLYTLIRHGVVTNISKEDYISFNRLYKKTADEVTAADIKWFKALLRKTKVNSQGTLRLIGDELADRGANDYFTLSILAKLYNRTNVEVLVSNHSIEFIRAFEKAKTYISENLGFGQAASMQNLQQLIDKKLITRAQVDAVVKNKYLPNVKLLSYTLDDANGRIGIFTHAPVGMECLQAIAAKLGVEFKDKSINDLAQTIENINNIFNEQYVKTNRVHTLFDSETGFRDPAFADPVTAPFTHLIWNRDHNVNRPVDHKGYKIKWIHGHDARPSNILHRIYNLDNFLGKGNNNNIAPYNVHHTHEKQLGVPKVFAKVDVEVLDESEEEIIAPSRLDLVKQGFATFKDTFFAPSKHPIIAGTLAATLATAASFALALTPLNVMLCAVMTVLTVGTFLRTKNSIANAALQNYTANPIRTPLAKQAYQDGIKAAKGWAPYAKSNIKLSNWKKPTAFAAGMESELRKPRI